MNVRFATHALERLETDPDFTMRLSGPLVTKYRQRIQGIRTAKDTRDLRNMRSWHLEKLKGSRAHQHSLRLNDQVRLIIELNGSGEQTDVVVIAVEDYH